MNMHCSFLGVGVAVLIVTTLIIGCSTVREVPSPTSSQQDPIVGLWVSHQPDSTTFYRLFGNGTFSAWSNTGDIHPKSSFQYSGQWEPRGSGTYFTEGPNIGYGADTPLAIWREQTLVYDSRSDTFSTVHPDQVFTRVSHDPDSPVP
jgi:hypothetical protein